MRKDTNYQCQEWKKGKTDLILLGIVLSIYYTTKWDLVLLFKDDLTLKTINAIKHINIIKEVIPYSQLNRLTKLFDKIQQQFRIKIISKRVREWNFFGFVINIYKTPTAVITLNGERQDTSF